MPNFDQTGPQGFGPRTGRSLGPCGLGLRRGRGIGRYFGRPWPQTTSDQVKELQDYTKSLEEELDLAKSQIQDLQKENK